MIPISKPQCKYYNHATKRQCPHDAVRVFRVETENTPDLLPLCTAHTVEFALMVASLTTHKDDDTEGAAA